MLLGENVAELTVGARGGATPAVPEVWVLEHLCVLLDDTRHGRPAVRANALCELVEICLVDRVHRDVIEVLKEALQNGKLVRGVVAHLWFRGLR